MENKYFYPLILSFRRQGESERQFTKRLGMPTQSTYKGWKEGKTPDLLTVTRLINHIRASWEDVSVDVHFENKVLRAAAGLPPVVIEPEDQEYKGLDETSKPFCLVFSPFHVQYLKL